MNNTNSKHEVIAKIHTLIDAYHAPFVIAFDGRSGSGKSTLALSIAEEFNGVIIKGDDFFAGGEDNEWRALTPEEKVARCIDWKRLKNEALEPLLAKENAIYSPFDFKSGVGLAADTIDLNPSDLIILDGVYSARPELADLINYTILVEAENDSIRRKRLIDREGESFMKNWHKIWDVAEEYYFQHIRPPSSFDLTIRI